MKSFFKVIVRVAMSGLEFLPYCTFTMTRLLLKVTEAAFLFLLLVPAMTLVSVLLPKPRQSVTEDEYRQVVFNSALIILSIFCLWALMVAYGY